VQRHPGLTGHVLHLVEPEGRRRYVEVAGANAALEPPAEIPGGGTLLVSTAVPRAAAEAAVRAGRAAGVWVAVDVAGDVETARAALPFADVVRGDADEIEALLGHAVTDFRSAAAAARHLLAGGVEIAVVQAGSAGDVVVRGEEEVRLPRLDVPVVDPTGGGDALIATLLVLVARGRPLPDAARLASAAAAHTVARLGGRPTFRGEADLAALLSRASPA
jgi:ribokinase